MFHPFQVEQYLSEREQTAKYHFAESGVYPLTLSELIEIAGVDMGRLGSVLLDYPEVNGLSELRSHIASMYPGAEAGNVLVTVGASEANHVIASALLEPGDEIVAMSPTYQQLPGNARNAGVQVNTVPLVEDEGWALDLEALDRVVTSLTKVIALVNPNNPTGHILTGTERAAIVAAAERVGAWIVSDEVYAGTEHHTDDQTPSLWGEYDKVIAVNSMSKAYGLPGLRLGWLVAPDEVYESLWRRHEYATIAAGTIDMHLATAVLSPEVRPALTQRARRLIRTGFSTLTEGLAVHPGVFSVVPPEASAMSFVQFDLPATSIEFADELLRDEGLLVIPGSCFGMEDHFRFSSALPDQHLRDGLERLNRVAERLLGG